MRKNDATSFLSEPYRWQFHSVSALDIMLLSRLFVNCDENAWKRLRDVVENTVVRGRTGEE